MSLILSGVVNALASYSYPPEVELIGASAANSSGWGIVGAIAAMGAFLIHTIEQAHKKTPDEDDKPEE